MTQVKLLMTADEVAETLGVSAQTAYRIIRTLNSELEAKGYLTVTGRVNRKFFAEKFYGFPESEVRDNARVS